MCLPACLLLLPDYFLRPREIAGRNSWEKTDNMFILNSLTSFSYLLSYPARLPPSPTSFSIIFYLGNFYLLFQTINFIERTDKGSRRKYKTNHLGSG